MFRRFSFTLANPEVEGYSSTTKGGRIWSKIQSNLHLFSVKKNICALGNVFVHWNILVHWKIHLCTGKYICALKNIFVQWKTYLCTTKYIEHWKLYFCIAKYARKVLRSIVMHWNCYLCIAYMGHCIGNTIRANNWPNINIWFLKYS